jgi:hypothetical protein
MVVLVILVCGLGSGGDDVDLVDLDIDLELDIDIGLTNLDLDLGTAMHSIDFILNKTEHHDDRAMQILVLEQNTKHDSTPIAHPSRCIVAHLVQGTFSKHRWTLVTFGAGTICE